MVEKLCTRIDEAKKAGEPLNMRLVYSCFTTDVITRYALNESWNHLDSSNFSPLWCQAIKETAAMTKWTKQFPFLYHALTGLPHWLVGKLNPGMTLVLDMQRVSRSCYDVSAKTKKDQKIKSLVQDIKDGKVSGADSDLHGTSRTIFHS